MAYKMTLPDMEIKDRRYGYETLVIWEHELCNQKKLLRRIIDFAMVGKG